MTNEVPRFQPTPNQIIEGKFGKEPIQEAAGISREILEQIKRGILDVGIKEGTSGQQEEEVKRYLQMWHEFANGLFARTSSDNVKSPEIVKTAIEGANALLSVESSRENEEPAKKMAEALNNKY